MNRHWCGRTIALALAIGACPAAAWDSVSGSPTRSYPMAPGVPAQFPEEMSAERLFAMQIVKDALGAPTSANGDVPTRILRCLPRFALHPEDGGGNLSDCQLAAPEDLSKAKPAWLAPRRIGEIAHQSEHTLITRRAAQLAGLIPATKLFDPFWVRYPAQNTWVGSELEFAGPTPTALIVGQSLLPVNPLPGNFAFVTRGISLLELSQAPDISHSLADWAAGNELCPIAGIEDAYRGVHLTEACHKFEMAMGAVNATHFKPLNREMWSYYHTLAINTMLECRTMAGLKSTFYTAWASTWHDRKVFSDDHTEAHECERLAMAYEMVAQHYLQDAWSAGHMWARWGRARFDEFPMDLKPLASEVPASNVPARRALTAGMVAAMSGMVHGAKPVVLDLAQQMAGVSAATYAEKRGFFDDPLNSGRYAGKDVQWAVGTSRFAGAGDLFWHPLVQPGGVVPPIVSTDSKYAEQRNRLLNCAAASLREVYRAGLPTVPAHGANNEAVVPSAVKTLAPSSETCWGNWVTNEAIYGSLGPVDLAYVDRIERHSLNLALAAVNEIVVEDFNSKLNFSTAELDEVPLEDELERARVKDRDSFLFKFRMRLARDSFLVRSRFLYNSTVQSTGTQSARGEIIGTPEPIAFLDVTPINTVNPVPSPPRGVDYVDAPRPLIASSFTRSDLQEALSRVFWRGDLQRTCRSSVENGATSLLELKRRCAESAQLGGDAEACTACVSIAELHIPNCANNPSSPVGPSKCSAIGAESTTAPPVGLPTWWFDNHARRLGLLPESEGPFHDSLRLCSPGIYVALEWCTDTTVSVFEPNEPVAELPHVRPYLTTSQFDCSTASGEPNTQTFGTSYERLARMLLEDSATPGRPWLFPMVTSFERSHTSTPGSDPCNDAQTTWTASTDQLVAFQTEPASQQEFWNLYRAGADIARCGPVQRVSWWNRGCDEVDGILLTGVPSRDVFQVETGALLQEAASPDPLLPPSCYVREPRTIFESCPAGLQCSAGGECVVPVPGTFETSFSDFSPTLAIETPPPP